MNINDVKWYIEKEFFWEGQPDTILASLKQLGVEYKFGKPSSIVSSTSEIKPFPDDQCVIIYGSIGFVHAIHNKTAWLPGALWVDKKNLHCSTYYSYYGKYLLNTQYFFVPLSYLQEKDGRNFVYNTLMSNSNDEIFIRPDSPFKEFTGFVVSRKDFERRIKTMSYGDLSPNLLVLAARPKEIYSEYRFFVTKDEVITGSRYKFNGEHDENPEFPQEAYDIALEIAKEQWQPAPIFVVDIGDTCDGFKLIEINSFNCSGTYLCDHNKIALKACNIAFDEWIDSYRA